ncbi:hypothetical protein OKW41_001093 [Paraburkholderia sp. UCT70]
MERVAVRKAIPRQKFLEWFASLEPCLVAMEACSAAHYWGRKLRALGHEVRLIAPQFAAAYRKGGKHVKNDRLDAEAICEAASRPHMGGDNDYVRSCCLTKECYSADCCRFRFLFFLLSWFAGRGARGPRRLSTFAQLTLRLAHQRTFAGRPE